MSHPSESGGGDRRPTPAAARPSRRFPADVVVGQGVDAGRRRGGVRRGGPAPRSAPRPVRVGRPDRGGCRVAVGGGGGGARPVDGHRGGPGAGRGVPGRLRRDRGRRGGADRRAAGRGASAHAGRARRGGRRRAAAVRRELAAACTCEPWVDPCEHALAVLHQVGWLVDRDPSCCCTCGGCPATSCSPLCTPAPGRPRLVMTRTASTRRRSSWPSKRRCGPAGCSPSSTNRPRTPLRRRICCAEGSGASGGGFDATVLAVPSAPSIRDPPVSPLASYRRLFRLAGPLYVVVAFLGRLPAAMSQMGTLLLVSAATGPYAAGGPPRAPSRSPTPSVHRSRARSRTGSASVGW